ncbi:MAG: elongation factor P maturation arginine rhamnosyltransferase EarP [Polynucleobacter sp.]|nr:elongation factor P maturation arginine rhamnosyltransferase EarP [Polynucleobacter sp.]
MRWDIFCQIVDNYGDAGICWRLARSLAIRYKQEVRLFCDDLPTLNLLASGHPPIAGLEILPWEASHSNARHPLSVPEVVIEAFGCELPQRYVASLLIATRPPVLINLEYLSAESWVGDYHAKASPQTHGLTKYFFFPGFQTNTGGLLLEPLPPIPPPLQPPHSLATIWQQLRPAAKRISIFCYPAAPLQEWLTDLATLNGQFDILLTFGHASYLDQSLELPRTIQLYYLPFIPPDDYDWLLSQCDFNIVRGEDSFVRAQLAEKPFFWHIYPQTDLAHEVKLKAFLDLYLENASPALISACWQASHWQVPSTWWLQLPRWEAHAKLWRAKLLKEQADGGLAARLLHFVE